MAHPEDPLVDIGKQVLEINQKVAELKSKAKIDFGLSAGFAVSAVLYKFIEVNGLSTPTIPIFSGNEVLYSLLASGYCLLLGLSNYGHAQSLRRFNMFGQRILYIGSKSHKD